ncbi:DUF2017 family protein [Lentzea cavernae]|uniref:DUF2017 domain-containing protein n=1 Tax=Lentzea cavernae TaxID=2020703 RepID=A0ABQ3MS52_9PSEU|nr:hypothetical protein [Lentzea cavernae]GHH56626.1 hypothetical protein GCM10017774_75010 [Lentzea cavernae]
MICWDRCGDEIVGYFDDSEIEVLRAYAESLILLLDRRAASYRSLGRVRVPGEATTDPRVLALLRAELGPGEPDWVLASQESSCLARVAGQVRDHLATLPESGGVVRLTSEQSSPWRRVLSWYLAVIDAVTDGEGRDARQIVEPTVGWLTEIASGLDSLGHGHGGRHR